MLIPSTNGSSIHICIKLPRSFRDSEEDRYCSFTVLHILEAWPHSQSFPLFTKRAGNESTLDLKPLSW